MTMTAFGSSLSLLVWWVVLMEILDFPHLGCMKKLFYIGILLLVGFELANVYFILPMPGSQEMDSVGLAHYLYTWRWGLRAGGG